MIVCVCKAVNDRAIRRAVAEGHDTFDALQFELGVGTCCGKCVPTAHAVLSDARQCLVDPAAASTARPTIHAVSRPLRREPAFA